MDPIQETLEIYCEIVWEYIRNFSTTETSCQCEFHRENPNSECVHIVVLRSYVEAVEWDYTMDQAVELFDNNNIDTIFTAIMIVVMGFQDHTITDGDIITQSDVEFYYTTQHVSRECLTRYQTTTDWCSCTNFEQHGTCYHQIGKRDRDREREDTIRSSIRFMEAILAASSEALNERTESELMFQEDTLLIEKRQRLYQAKCEDEECGVCYTDKSLRIPCCRQHMCLDCWETMESRGMSGCPFCRTQMVSTQSILV